MSNRMDRVTLVNNIVKFKIQCNTSAPFNILRNQMKLFLIEEILKSHHERRDEMILQRLRTETVGMLKILDPEDRKRKKQYTCCLTGCLFRDSAHREILRHISRVHPHEDRLMCNYGLKCRMTFTGIDALTQHVEFTHRKKDRRKHLVSINT